MSLKISDFFCMCCGVWQDQQFCVDRPKSKRMHKKPRCRVVLDTEKREENAKDIDVLAKEIAYPQNKKTIHQEPKHQRKPRIGSESKRLKPLKKKKIVLSEALRHAIICECLKQMDRNKNVNEIEVTPP